MKPIWRLGSTGFGRIMLDEEIIGLGKYEGHTLTVLTGETLPEKSAR